MEMGSWVTSLYPCYIEAML